MPKSFAQAKTKTKRENDKRSKNPEQQEKSMKMKIKAKPLFFLGGMENWGLGLYLGCDADVALS